MKEAINDLITAFTMTMGFFVALFNVIKIILMPTKRTLNAIVSSMFVGWPIGFLAGWVANDSGVGEKLSIAIACMFVLIAEKTALFFMQLDVKALLQKAVDNSVDKYTK